MDRKNLSIALIAFVLLIIGFVTFSSIAHVLAQSESTYNDGYQQGLKDGILDHMHADPRGTTGDSSVYLKSCNSDDYTRGYCLGYDHGYGQAAVPTPVAVTPTPVVVTPTPSAVSSGVGGDQDLVNGYAQGQTDAEKGRDYNPRCYSQSTFYCWGYFRGYKGVDLVSSSTS